MEDLVSAYQGKRVLVTGHTGFKGGWLALWLHQLGAKVTGFALPPDTAPSLFELAGVGHVSRSIEGDVRELALVRQVLKETEPDHVFHLAAQAIVRRSYQEPLETLETNVMGTANVLEALRLEKRPCAAVIVTSDKCYENKNWVHGYREDDAMGGHDVYSMSKGAAELVTASYRRSFFPIEKGIAVASARAGNVIGGGDYGADRIIPDCVQAIAQGRPIPVRNPDSVRPWQHVLEPLSGYLTLGSRLAQKRAPELCSAFNFGPRLEDAQPVRRVVELLIARYGKGSWEDKRDPGAPHEAGLLRLSCEKAQALLGWLPRWSLEDAVSMTADWYRAYDRGEIGMGQVCIDQIRSYEKGHGANGG